CSGAGIRARGGGGSQARADQKAGERPEDKAAGEKSVRFGVIAAEHFVDAELKGVVAADHGEIVGEFIAAQDADVGDKNVRSQVIDKTGNLEPHLSGHVG